MLSPLAVSPRDEAAPKRTFSAMNAVVQPTMLSTALAEAAAAPMKRAEPLKRRKVTEHKDTESGGFGIRLAEAHGAEENLSQPRIMVESLSRSQQLDAGDRWVVKSRLTLCILSLSLARTSDSSQSTASVSNFPSRS